MTLPADVIGLEDRAAVAGRTLGAAELEGVYQHRGRDLFGLCRRLGLSDDEANDAVQETFLRMWNESQRGVMIIDPEGWAFRVAYRIAMDQHRLSRLARAVVDRLASTTNARDQVDPVDRLSVWGAVDHLPPRQRAVLYLRYRADLPYDKIAAVMGITANGARNDASAAAASLRRRLRPEDGHR